jgi:hypothetical protein
MMCQYTFHRNFPYWFLVFMFSCPCDVVVYLKYYVAPLLFVCLTASSHHVAAPLFRPCEAGASPHCTDSRGIVCEMKAQSRHIATTQPPWVHCSYASLTCSSCLLNTIIFFYIYLFIFFPFSLHSSSCISDFL